MKKRRIAIWLFLLVACISLGIGYSALSDSFTIYGDLGANVDNTNLVVVFDGETTDTSAVSTVDGTYCNFATSQGAAAIDGRTSVELTIGGMTTNGNVATAKLVVVNRSTNFTADELDATLSSPVLKLDSIDSDMFEVTAEWEDSSADGLVLEPGESNTIIVTITLKQTPTTSVDASTFEITFTATTK